MTERVRDMFMAGFPKKACEFLVMAAYEACVAAHGETRNRFNPEQRADLVPHLRRAHFQQRCAEMTVPGVSVQVLKNDGETSHFVQLATQDVVLVALTRSKRPTELPPALYRETRARSSQLSLFDKPAVVAPDAKLFGVCIFGASPQHVEPSLCEIVFPLPDGRLLPDAIDLLSAHAGVVKVARVRFGFQARDTERSETARPRLRIVRPQDGGAGDGA